MIALINVGYDVLDFLKEFGTILLYAVALLFSVVRYPKYYDSVLKYFPIIIGYTFLTEILGAYIKINENFQIVFIDEHSINNSLIFNIFDIIFYCYFFYILWKSLKPKNHKRVVKFGSFLFIIISFINPFFQNFELYPQIYAITAGSITLIISIILYFRQLKVTENTPPIRNNLLFWITLGLLIFYTAYPFLMIIGLSHIDIYTKFNLRQIHQVLLSLMYICFIIGFIRMRRTKSLLN